MRLLRSARASLPLSACGPKMLLSFAPRLFPPRSLHRPPDRELQPCSLVHLHTRRRIHSALHSIMIHHCVVTSAQPTIEKPHAKASNADSRLNASHIERTSALIIAREPASGDQPSRLRTAVNVNVHEHLQQQLLAIELACVCVLVRCCCVHTAFQAMLRH